MAELLQMPLRFDAEPAQESACAVEPPQDSVPDELQRRLALDVRQSWIVEAPAGSGKTGLLIQRFLKLLAYGGVEHPREVLAITFTRKADAEMKLRILQQLQAAATTTELPDDTKPFDRATRKLAQAVLERDRLLGWELLTNPQQLNIRTIDSLCAEIADSMPLLQSDAGAHAPVDDAEPLYEEAARRTLLHLGGADEQLSSDLEWLLLYRDADPEDFVRLLAEMLKQREQWGELVPLDAAQLTDKVLNELVLPRLNHTLQSLLNRDLTRLAHLLGEDLRRTFGTLAHSLSSCASYGPAPSPLACCRELPGPLEGNSQDLARWRALHHLAFTVDEKWRKSFSPRSMKFELPKEQQLELKCFVGDLVQRALDTPTLETSLKAIAFLPDPVYPQEQWDAVKVLCRVLRQGLLDLQLVFAETEACDFTEIALNAKALLTDSTAMEDLLQLPAFRLRHLLVDEMQDTSAGQYNLLETLTQSWDGATQTIFLVGDPKQSIYEFRLARVERFLRVLREGRFGQVQLGALQLTANFRSQAGMVDAFNEMFQQILPSPDALREGDDSGDVPFIAADATKKPTKSPALLWRLPVQDDEPGDESAEPQEAVAFRRIIEDFQVDWRLRKGALEAPKIAVLARTRKDLAPIARELSLDHGRGSVPYRAVDVDALKDRPEILDLLALTRALLHPGDRVAWLSVLRSPLCGLSLADLLKLTGDGETGDAAAGLLELAAMRREALSSLGQQLLTRSLGVLETALRETGRTPLSVTVERTWRSLGGDLSLVAHERANADTYFRLLRKLQDGPQPVSFALLLRRLGKLYAEPAALGAGAVEMMTIHKAKGLEWDLVLVPSLQRRSGQIAASFLQWLEFDGQDGRAEFLLAPIQGKGEEASELFRWFGQRRGRREHAEAKRLLYVACTRAREQLVLSASLSRKQDGALVAPVANTLLAAAWPAALAVLEPQRKTSSLLEFPRAVSEEAEAEPLALAAVEEGSNSPERDAGATLGGAHLPLSLDLRSRFERKYGLRLPYPPADSLTHEEILHRPSGSFSSRAFGNVTHRMLQFVAKRIAEGRSLSEVTRDIADWRGRLTALLRQEGLAHSAAVTEADRVAVALRSTLLDEAGRWVLSPHLGAKSEVPLVASADPLHRGLRPDRSFWAGKAPGQEMPPDYLWIVDYKTAAVGGHSRDSFVQEQMATYADQLMRYARAASSTSAPLKSIILGLYFPLLPGLVYWNAFHGTDQYNVT